MCDICGYSTPQLSNLKDHMGSVHAKKKNFTCNVCEKQFYAKRKMEKHIKSKYVIPKNYLLTYLLKDLISKSFSPKKIDKSLTWASSL